jgi:hypothetical protein
MQITPKRPFPQWRFLQLTVTIFAWLLFLPHLSRGWTVHLALQVMLLDLMLVTIWANPRWVPIRRLVSALWVLALAASIIDLAGLTREWARIDLTVQILLTTPVVVACVAGVLSFAFRAQELTTDGIFATVVAYLLIALAYGQLYGLLLVWNPGALHFPTAVSAWTPYELRGNLMYFSLVTISTVGYGDVLPVSPAARTIAASEALVGQFYVAVVVAMFVSMYITEARARRSTSQDTSRSGGDS